MEQPNRIPGLKPYEWLSEPGRLHEMKPHDLMLLIAFLAHMHRKGGRDER